MEELEAIIHLKGKISTAMSLINEGDKEAAMVTLASVYKAMTEREMGRFNRIEEFISNAHYIKQKMEDARNEEPSCGCDCCIGKACTGCDHCID